MACNGSLAQCAASPSAGFNHMKKRISQFIARIVRKVEKCRTSLRRQRTADAIREARRERDLCRKQGLTEWGNYCQFKARCLFISTYL